MSTPSALARFERSMVTKFSDKCGFCGTPTTVGVDYAVLNNGKWMGVCQVHALSIVEQCKARVVQIQAAAPALNEAQMAAIDAHCPANLPDILAGNGSTHDVLTTALALDSAVRVAQLFKAESEPAAPAPIRSNRFAAKCVTCGKNVAEGVGRIERNDAGKWLTFHLDGQCPEVETQPQAGEGLYQHDDGSVRKVYMTRNDRLACKLLTATVNPNHDPSDPKSPTHFGSFEYETGGRTIVAKALLAGTAHQLTQAEAAAYGSQYHFCCNCALYLDDDRSLAAGYGPTCASNHGWHYPSYTEAASILKRPVTNSAGKVFNP